MKLHTTIILLIFGLFLSATAQGQNILKGIVRDKEGVLVGATIYAANENKRMLTGVTTNVNGEYLLNVPSGKDITIVYSYIGYKSQEISFDNQKILNITLEMEISSLEAVTVSAKAIERGYLGIPERNQGIANQKISMDEMKEMQATSIEDALQGRLANVDIIASSGDPGSRMAIRIRGTNSLNASSEPLVVVDGIPYNTEINDDFDFATADAEDFGALVNISPSDIESIEVLKDAAATAIWGSKGANGVLMINTKRGTAGKTRFSFSQKLDFKSEPTKIKLLDGKQYVTMIQDALWNRLFDQGFNFDLMDKLDSYHEINFDPAYEYYDEYNQNTKWIDLVTQNALTSETNFSMSGGGDRALYRFSVGYLDEGGTTKGTGFQRLSTRLNVDYNFSTKLRVSAGFAFAQGNRDNNWSNAREEAQIKMPNMSPYLLDDNGNKTSEYFTPLSYFQGSWSDGRYNPVAMVKESYNNRKERDIRMTLNLRYTILSGLLFQSDIGFDIKSAKNKKFLPQSVTGVNFTNAYYNRSQDDMTESLDINMNHKLIYTKSFNSGHQMILTTMLQTHENTYSSYSSAVSGISSINLSDPTAQGKIASLNSGKSKNRTFAAVFSAHYNYKDRYTLTGIYRREGNSRMGNSTRYGGFPSIDAVWRPSEEVFLKDEEWLSDLKIRGSWGKSGNSPKSSYPYIGRFSSAGSYITSPAVAPDKIQLNNLKWEVVTQKNLGLDMSIFNNKFSFTFDLYQKITDDLLQENVTISSATGFTKVAYFNSGKVKNYGWEFRIDTRNLIKSNDFDLSVNFNIARNRNKILELPQNMKRDDYSFGNGNYAQIINIGEPLGSFYGYEYQGVYQNRDETIARDVNGNKIYDLHNNPVYTSINNFTVQPGDAKYRDINYDGVINQYDIVYLGNSMPSVTGGAGINIGYKNLKLRSFFQYRLGQSVINRTRINTENMYGTNNQSTAVLRRWRYEGDQTDIPRAMNNRGYNYLGSDRFVDDASFFRLKQLTLLYSIPKQFLSRIHINRAEVYITSYDLITWTKYKGQDPEVGFVRKDLKGSNSLYEYAEDRSFTPRPTRVAVGLSVDF